MRRRCGCSALPSRTSVSPSCSLTRARAVSPRGRARSRRRCAPAASPARSTPCCLGPASSRSIPTIWSGSAARATRPTWVAAGAVHGGVPRCARRRGRARLLRADPPRRAARGAADEQGAAARASIRAVFVDEYQDTDPSQVRLLQAIAGDGRDLVVVGDPDQSIYAFRGADVRGILEFPTQFPRADGQPAPVAALVDDPAVRRPAAHRVPTDRQAASG